MVNKMKFLRVIPFMILFLTGIYFLPVQAYTTLTLVDDIWFKFSSVAGSNVPVNNPLCYRTLHHSTGKYVFATVNPSDSEHIHVYIMSSVGGLIADVDTGALSQGGVSMCEFDATKVLIAYGKKSDGAVCWFTIDLSTFVQSATATSTQSGLSGSEQTTKIGNIIYNAPTTRFYICMTGFGLSGGGGSSIMYYTNAGVAGETVKITTAGLGSGTSNNIWGYLDATNQHIYYLIGATTYHFADFNIGAGTLTDLATCPFSGGYPSNDASANGSEWLYSNVYDMGIYTDTVTGHNYLYIAWSFSARTGTYSPMVQGVRYVDTWFWYCHFTGAIGTGTLADNIRIECTHSDSSGSLNVASGLSCGYLFHNSASATFDIYSYYQDIYSGKFVSQNVHHITDITALPTGWTSDTQYRGVDNRDFKYNSYDYITTMNALTGISVGLSSVAVCKFSIGGSILAKVYTFSGSYAPTDNPMLVDTPYTFTYTIYVNGVVDNLGEQYKLFINGIERATGNIDNSTGTFVQTYQFSTAQDYVMVFSVYNSGVLQATSPDYTYTLTTTTGGGGVVNPPVVIGNYAYLFSGFIPVAFCVLAPILMLGMLGSKMGGAGAMVGMLIGAIVGVIAGVNTSLLPSYTIYLMAMAVVAGLVVFVKMGGGGGGGSN